MTTKKLKHVKWPLLVAIAMLTFRHAGAADEQHDQGRLDYIYGVCYLGTAGSDADSVNKKITKAASIAKKQEGRIYVTDTGMEFSAMLPKRVGSYVTAAIFGRDDGAHASFLEGNRILKIEANGRAWLFYREAGFDPRDGKKILELFEPRKAK